MEVQYEHEKEIYTRGTETPQREPLHTAGNRRQHQRHILKLLSAHFEYDEGLLWVYYSREGLDRNGEVMVGSWEVQSL